MADPLQRVNSGDRFGLSAARENLMRDAARWVRDNARQIGAGDSATTFKNTTIFTVKNLSGADIDRFGVLGVVDTLFTPTDNPDLFKTQVVLKGAQPLLASHFGRCVVALEPIKNNKLGRCYGGGMFPAKINIQNANDCFADVKDNDATMLQSIAGWGRYRIRYAETGTGIKFAIVETGWTPAGTIFRVALTQTGGSNGNKTTAASWTYTAKDLAAGVNLGTGLSPERSRPKGTRSAATIGIGYYDGVGVFHLYEADETPGRNDC